MVEKRLGYKKIHERKAKRNPDKGHFFELNTGPFGGDDGEQYMKAYNKTVEQFSKYLAQKNSKSYKELMGYVKYAADAETEGPGKNLMAENMTRKADALIENARKLGKKRIVIAVTDPSYLNEGEEDKKLQDCINKKVRESGDMICDLITVQDLLTSLMIGKTTLKEIFLYNDFTGKELEAYCNDENHAYDFQKVKNTILRMDKLDPLEIEHLTDRSYNEDLDIDVDKFDLLNPAFAKKDLSYEYNKQTGEVEILYKGDVLNLKNLIRKPTGSFGGKVRFFEHPDPDLSFNLYDIVSQLNDENPENDFVFEDIHKLPETEQPLELRGVAENVKESVYTRNLNRFDIDTRIGYVYDPVKDELKPISLYGRFNVLGEPNNIARGAGVIGIHIIKDRLYDKMKIKTLQLMQNLDEEEARWFHHQLGENLKKEGFLEKGNVVPYATVPHFMSETAFNEINQTSLEIARKIVAARGPRYAEEAISFAVDASVNPKLKKLKIKLTK